MQVTLNGEPKEIGARTAAELLDELGLTRNAVVVERNEVILKRGELDQVDLEAGDTIEIIQMIAGG